MTINWYIGSLLLPPPPKLLFVTLVVFPMIHVYLLSLVHCRWFWGSWLWAWAYSLHFISVYECPCSRRLPTVPKLLSIIDDDGSQSNLSALPLNVLYYRLSSRPSPLILRTQQPREYDSCSDTDDTYNTHYRNGGTPGMFTSHTRCTKVDNGSIKPRSYTKTRSPLHYRDKAIITDYTAECESDNIFRSPYTSRSRSGGYSSDMSINTNVKTPTADKNKFNLKRWFSHLYCALKGKFASKSKYMVSIIKLFYISVLSLTMQISYHIVYLLWYDLPVHHTTQCWKGHLCNCSL